MYLGIYHYFMAGHYDYVSIIFHGDLVILTVAQKRLVFDKQIADFYISTQLTNTILKLNFNFWRGNIETKLKYLIKIQLKVWDSLIL